MNRRAIGRRLAMVAALAHLGTAALHATGFGDVSRLAAQAPGFLGLIAPALWLSFSFDLAVVGLIIALVAARPGPGGRAILGVASLCPLGAVGLQLRFLGFIPPTAILLADAALALGAALVLPGPGTARETGPAD